MKGPWNTSRVGAFRKGKYKPNLETSQDDAQGYIVLVQREMSLRACGP